MVLIAKKELKFHFHNPNSAEVTAEYLLGVFIEANRKKVENTLKAEAQKQSEKETKKGDYAA